MTKKLVTASDELFGRHCSYTRDELIQRIDAKLATLTEDQRATASFEIDSVSYQYDDGEYYGFYIKYQRLETDYEEHRRELQEAEYAKEKEERDRREFERLSKQFGPKA